MFESLEACADFLAGRQKPSDYPMLRHYDQYELSPSGKTLMVLSKKLTEPAGCTVENLQQARLRQALLLEFQEITSYARKREHRVQNLLRYLRKHRLHTFSHKLLDNAYTFSTNEDAAYEFSIDAFLEESAFLCWLMLVAEAIKERNINTISKWIVHTEDPPMNNAPPMGVINKTDGTVMADPKGRTGATAFSEMFAIVWLRPSADDCPGFEYLSTKRLQQVNETVFREGFGHSACVDRSDDSVLKIARKYLAGQINNLIKDIPHLLDQDLVLNYRIRDQQQAMYLALCEVACGASSTRRCRNPNCPTGFFLPEREDQVYCKRRACREWGRINLGRVRKTRSHN